MGGSAQARLKLNKDKPMKKAVRKTGRKSPPRKRVAARAAGRDDRFALALGTAIIEMWPAMPQKMQKNLFEAAVIAGHHDERDEALREQLALFLHTRHPRSKVFRGR
jgi:hypothetical protein